MKRIIVSIVVISVLIIVASIVVVFDRQKAKQSNNPQTTLQNQTKPTSADYPLTEVLAENLSVPWDLVFLPNGDILFTERDGVVKHLYLSTDQHVQTVATIDAVRQTSEGGLHGIALHPDFQKNRYIYLYYTYAGSNGRSLNRVSRFSFQNDTLSNETIILDEIPGAQNHDGGRIRFGDDGYLYVTTGDAQEPSLAQNINSIAGKLLRMTDEGEPAPENPFGNLVYSYGHRNSQGITWDNMGNLWSTEHGPSSPIGADCCRDEINLIKPGKNYGWPEITGDQTASGMVSPAFQSGPDTVWAPASVAYIDGSLYFGGLRGSALYQAVVRDEEVLEVFPHFEDQFGRIRGVTLGPDNMLYITTSNRDGRGIPKTGDDKIIRVNPSKL